MPREYYNYLLSKNEERNFTGWEDKIVDNIDIEDLDHNEILSTMKEGIANGRIPEGYLTNDIKKILSHFRIVRDKKLKATAVV